MYNFIPLNINYKSQIDKIFADSQQNTSDFSFANLFAWSEQFLTEFTIIEDSFFLRSNCCPDKSCYIFPVGKMNLKKSIEFILNDAKKRNRLFKMIAITYKMWDEINSIFPNTFSYHPERKFFEYVYLSENLINLKGSKFQSKRNHINRFKKENPSWKYKRINNSNEINQCLAMLNCWEKTEEKRLCDSQYAEYFAVKKMLDNYEKLNLIVAAIFVNEKIIAFSIGEILNNDTFVVHCEKAFSQINGAYSIINQQFVENEASNFKYINREEDLGIEGLRKAKMSYYPNILIEKGSVELIK